MPRTYVGLSGWDYKGWAGDFYPTVLPRTQQLGYVASIFDTAEVNSAFYSLKRPSVFQNWLESVSPGFIFAIKGGRFITHILRLREAETALANFMASGVLLLGESLGPFLWQLPPNMDFDEATVRHFCGLLPRTHAEAAELARKHEHRVVGRAAVDPTSDGPVRHAFEVRDQRFLTPAFISILREHGHALVFSDTGGKWPYAEDITADFIYLRLHGSPHCYASGYGEGGADYWMPRIKEWAQGRDAADPPKVDPSAPTRTIQRDVYVYFDNDALGHAPFDALLFMQRLSRGGRLKQLITTPDGQQWPIPPRLSARTG